MICSDCCHGKRSVAARFWHGQHVVVGAGAFDCDEVRNLRRAEDIRFSGLGVIVGEVWFCGGEWRCRCPAWRSQ